jgi:hypothetical protein
MAYFLFISNLKRFLDKLFYGNLISFRSHSRICLLLAGRIATRTFGSLKVTGSGSQVLWFSALTGQPRVSGGLPAERRFYLLFFGMLQFYYFFGGFFAVFFSYFFGKNLKIIIELLHTGRRVRLGGGGGLMTAVIVVRH